MKPEVSNGNDYDEVIMSGKGMKMNYRKQETTLIE